MAYKIAVSSGDGLYIDTSFGVAQVFDIYEAEGTEYHLLEKREYKLTRDTDTKEQENTGNALTSECGAGNSACGSENGCGTSSGCGTGGGCGSMGETFSKVQLISDCRCVICKKLGFQIRKQLDKLAITGFDVDCTVKEALDKITVYIDKIDNHQSLRGIQNQKS